MNVIGIRVVCACVLTSCERPPADGSRPLSLGRLSFGELHPETGVLLLLGDESVKKKKVSTLLSTFITELKSTLSFKKKKNPTNLDLVCVYPVCQVLDV